MSYSKRNRKKRHKKLLRNEAKFFSIGVPVMNDFELTYICCECISDLYLSRKVETECEVSLCLACSGKDNPAISVSEISNQIHRVIDTYFYLTKDHAEGYECHLEREGLWGRRGTEIDQVIQDVAGVSEVVSNVVVDYLSSCYDSKGKDAYFTPQPYDSDAYYEERPSENVEFYESWLSFKSSVGRKARFFNDHANAGSYF